MDKVFIWSDLNIPVKRCDSTNLDFISYHQKIKNYYCYDFTGIEDAYFGDGQQRKTPGIKFQIVYL